MIGRRIAEARGRAAMTQAQLAAAISLERSAVTKIENGARRVSALELSRIAEALDERIEWFVSEAPESIVSHRNLRDPGAPSPAIDRIAERATRNAEFLQQNDKELDLPALPNLNRPSTSEESEMAADEARGALGLGRTEPLHNGSDLATTRLGLLTFSFGLGADAADAASILLERGAVALINGDRHVGRRRLAFAHELGHCLFADEYTVDWRVAENEGSDVWEARLDRFARALLLPPAGLEEAWIESRNRGDDLRTAAVRIASLFRVDMSTLAQRLFELNHTDRTLGDEIRRVRTTKADIVELNLIVHDELAEPAIPRAYENSVLRLFRGEVISAARATDLLFDTWEEADLPALPKLPESAIWQFVS